MLSHLFKTHLTLTATAASPFALQRAAFASSALAFKEATKQTKKPAKKTTDKKPAKKAASPKKAPAKPKKKVPAVKRSITPYSYFVQEYFKDNGAALKELPFAERAREISAKWGSFSESEKSPFVQRAQQDKERFLAEKKEYEASKGPKRPLNSYLRYFNSIRDDLKSQNPGLSVVEIGKLAGEKWRQLGEREKQEFSEAFQKELQQWKATVAELKK